jgi:quinoprotein glucose dehydrogenase
LYGTSPRLKLFALEADTGKEKWSFDPAEEDNSLTDDPFRYYKVNRGVTFWKDDNGANRRIFYNAGRKIFAIDAETGQPARSFGEGGYIDLSKGLDRENENHNPFIASTTPGIIFKNLLITGSRVAETADAAPGHIRGYDVMTGERKWIFHTIPHPGEPGHETWPDKEAYKKLGGANNWAGMSLDEEKGILYVPLGSVSGDFYGGIREGSNLFGNSLVALDAATGSYLWHFQTVHHDLWDRDLPANPNLIDLEVNGNKIKAVAQITKQGYIFVFDRYTGKPVFEIEEKEVPQNALPGEKPWPTQPVPVLPEPFARQQFEEDDVTRLSEETHGVMLQRYRQIKFKEMFTPPSKEGTWIFPGFDGGGEWGGAAVDPETQILYVNSSEVPWSMVMVDVPRKTAMDGSMKSSGRLVYDTHCFACHGADLKGSSAAFPSLVEIGQKYNPQEIRQILNNGINMMPSFNHLPEADKSAVIGFLTNRKVAPDPAPVSESKNAKEPSIQVSNTGIIDQVPYRMTGYNRFMDDQGYPGITPPWGTLNAVNLNTGKLLWKVPLGEHPELTARGIPITGTENYGGPAVTKGGLVFIAATRDSRIRAFDKDTGEVLWEADLPAPGYATPSVYSVNGKQYVVIACGGGKIGSVSGDQYVAFALPE